MESNLDSENGGSGLATAAFALIGPAVSMLEKIFGIGKTPYLQRLSAVALPIAQQRQTAVLAYMDSSLLIWYPNGQAGTVSTSVNSTNAGIALQTAVNNYGTTCVLITKIEPTQTKDVTPTEITGSGQGSILTTQTGSSNWALWALGGLALWMVLKRR